ncbi:energy-coupling factor transporter transmembrane component T [Microbacterium horticulturae]|uniref:Energy-coupling factor transporter transmembrane component T n=1 Tax=Microbacterium horticulturae TaxID=3028316 RepID=A0ABY8BZ14_9MICO|nr:energy-coupling factor transporter transmembrane component T [Microbacterium sp. KACC 23027]WEG09117.1 energy-coupling factor transporter transmembrane component T [Microbacterium sp. KACC 23027]
MTAIPAAGSARFLHGLNPLAKLLAPVPAMLMLIFVRDLATPLAFIVLAYALVLVGARVTARTVVMLFAVVPALVAIMTVGFALWTDPAGVAHDVVVLRLGGWTLYGAAVQVGLATGLRLAAIVALALVAGLTTTGQDLARSLVQQLRVPYRVGYTAIAAFRFVPRFRHELEIIRQAHRVRGQARGPLAALGRGFGYIVPLLAGAIRHAERVALAMDARAFGAYPDRTERHDVPFRTRDTVFVALVLAVSAALFALLWPWGR